MVLLGNEECGSGSHIGILFQEGNFSAPGLKHSTPRGYAPNYASTIFHLATLSATNEVHDTEMGQDCPPSKTARQVPYFVAGSGNFISLAWQSEFFLNIGK